MSPSLEGKVALVTGASRGVGKGVAQALGEAGATVYVTGRSRRGEKATVPLSGTIDETAELVTAAGGKGIAVVCDHGDDAQVGALFAQIKREQGRLDMLVNNAWGGYQAKQRAKAEGGRSGFRTVFWKMEPEFIDTMFTVGVRSTYVASVHAAAIMTQAKSGLIVHITSSLEPGKADNVAYGASRAAINAMAAEMARELLPSGVTVVALAPGYVATEMLRAGRSPEWILPSLETPHFVGRAVVALATDANALRQSGMVLGTRTLALEYGFTDLKGRLPKK